MIILGRKIILSLLVSVFLTGCASSSRMLRLSPYSVNSYKTPNSIYLSSKMSYNEDLPSEENRPISQDEIINVWPFYLKNNYFHSVLWPIFDYDQYGMAVRPFFNKEGNEYSILFPLAGWNTEKKNGWIFPITNWDCKEKSGRILNAWWNKDGWVFFPLACHNKYTEYYFPVCYTTYRDGSFGTFSIIPLFCYARPEHNDERLLVFPLGFVYKNPDSSIGLIANTYWSMDTLGVFPLFHKSEDFSYYLLYWQSPHENKWGIFPVFAKLGQDSWYCCLAFKNEKSYGFFPIFRNALDNSEGYFFPFYNYTDKEDEKRLNVLFVFDKQSKKSPEFILEKLTLFPFYQQQYKEYNKHRQKYYYGLNVKSYQQNFLLSLFGYEYQKYFDNVDDNNLFFYGEEEQEIEAYKFWYLGKIASAKLLTYQNNLPKEKYREVYTLFNKANELKRAIKNNDEKIIQIQQKSIQDLAKSLNIQMSNPKKEEDCQQLRQEIFEKYLTIKDEKTNYFLPFYYQKGTDTRNALASFPFFYYSQNELTQESYLNLLGILYNGSTSQDGYKFNLLGILSRGYRQGEESEFRVLEYLYRSREKNGEKDYLFFPFCYYRTSDKGSQFSFMYHLFNIEKSEKGTKGHIFYIPFGE